MRRALRFYADEYTWYEGTQAWLADVGHKARVALNQSTTVKDFRAADKERIAEALPILKEAKELLWSASGLLDDDHPKLSNKCDASGNKIRDLISVLEAE